MNIHDATEQAFKNGYAKGYEDAICGSQLAYFEMIANYFEDEENWRKLKNCWMISGKSEEFRNLLKQAMNM